MVVTSDSFIAQQDARRLIRGLGVPEYVLNATATAHPDVDWRRLATALDDVFLAYGGGMAQAGFMRQRQPELDGLTPIEMLPKGNGPLKVCLAAKSFARRSTTW
jgi:hypothetical protein